MNKDGVMELVQKLMDAPNTGKYTEGEVLCAFAKATTIVIAMVGTAQGDPEDTLNDVIKLIEANFDVMVTEGGFEASVVIEQ